MRKIKIAQIGMNQNSHGKHIAESLRRLSEEFEVVGYALPERERDKFPKRMSYLEGFPEMTVDQILDNPEIEAVVIETEEIYLTKYAQVAAGKGKHIHMEKPGGIGLGEFERLISTVKEKKVHFHVGYMYRYNPKIAELLRLVKSGELGDIISVEAQMNCVHKDEVRQWLATFPGGMMFFLGCHLIDLILQIQGKPERIIPLNACTGLNGVTAEDFGMAIFQYKNGVSFAKTSACENGGFARRQLVVSGTMGTVELKPLEVLTEEETKVYTIQTQYNSSNVRDRGVCEQSETFDRYDCMMSDFAAIVRGEQSHSYTPDYELELYKTILMACGYKEI